MPKPNQTDPRNSFTPLILPWLLGVAMFVVYACTLNHWVTMMNIGPMSQISGFVWQPQIYGPLMYLGTLPFHWLPTAQIPLALNLFSAICAALVLVLLARCVAITPQDRTELQRQREKSDFGFLTGWQSYFPPLVAVLMAGLQLTFWKNATNFTGELFDLLLFAFIIWQLLEFRLDEKEWRLPLAALLYGSGIAETWMFIGFLPVFLATILWLKKLEFFNLRFLTRLIVYGLGGMMFFFLLPLAAKSHSQFKIGLWEAMRPNIRLDWNFIKTIKQGGVRLNLAQASLGTLLPLLLMAIRWSSGFGDNSRIGAVLANNMVHFVHAAVFSVCLWIMFDPPFAPQQLLASPCLTLNFLCALSIGYCCGYFLLIFSRKPRATRRDVNPLPVFPPALMWLCPVIITCVFVISLAAVGALIYRNKPLIKEVNDDVLLKLAKFTTENLPENGAILMSDSDTPGQDQPLRALLIQSELAREGRSRNFLVLDTQSLNWAPYHRMIHEQYPRLFPLMVKPADPDGIPPISLFGLVSSLAKSNNVCYLNPSYGYYFEYFYQIAEGMVYPLKPLSEKTILPAPLDKDLMAKNEIFWDRVVDSLSGSVDRALIKPAPTPPRNAAEWLLVRLHPIPDVNENAIIAGMLCSRCLDDWGVRLQRAGELDKAARRFRDAKRFNPDNVVADINLAFNEILLTNQTVHGGTSLEIDPARVNADRFGKYRNWNAVVTANGPFDEISFSFEAGFQYVQNGFSRQAANEFARVRQLAPDNLVTRLQLAQVYLFNHLPDPALEAIHDPLVNPAKFGLSDDNSTGLDILAAAAHFQKNEVNDGSRLLDKEVARHPDDNTLLTAVTQAYFMRGLYTNALRVIDGQLARTPDDVTWLFGKGFASIQIGAYEASIKAMSRVLELQTNDSNARFNRALSYLQSGKLDQARADYTVLQAASPTAFQFAYGLGEIAWRKKQNPEALRNYEIYLANASTNAPEFSTIRERVTQLRGK